MKGIFVSILAVVQLTTAVIYRLNDTEYARMPKLYHLDDYYGCLLAPGDVYCNVDAKLVANDTNELYTLLQEYSANTITHYDHTEIHWGICVSRMCSKFLEQASSLSQGLEACLNSTLYEKYQLEAKLIHKTTVCTEFDESTEYDLGDYLFAVVVAALLLLSSLGTVYDTFFYKGTKIFASKILLCFSIKRNWERLVAPSGEGPDPRLRRLKGLNGFKVISTLLVIMAHSALTGLSFIDNPERQEDTYRNLLYQFLYNGTFVVQTFFIISGFLLAYNMLISTEKRPASFAFLPQAIFVRWLRLIPAYAVIIGFVSTWLRHLGSGPLWKPVVDIEVIDCRRDWWLHVLFIDNYVDSSQCMAQTWYLSSDMQLSILGLLIFCALQSSRARKIAVAATFVVGLLTPAVHTYFQDLFPILIVSPEHGLVSCKDRMTGWLRANMYARLVLAPLVAVFSNRMARRYFVEDATFNNLYKRGHTNLICYALGLGLGMLMYQLHAKDLNLDKYKKYQPIYWIAFPVGIGIVFCGMIFYVDGVEIPLTVRVVYSSVVRLIFGLSITFLIGGTIGKIENVYRSVLEWNGWTALSRLSYCAYLLHVTIVRTSIIHCTSLQHNTFYKMVINFFGIVGMTYVLAVLCWMLVETPLQNVIKICLGGGQKGSPKEAVHEKKVTEVKQ